MKKLCKAILKLLDASLPIILGSFAWIGLSWVVTCGFVKLITLCFGIDFTWGIGTGVWLSLFLISTVTGKKK